MTGFARRAGTHTDATFAWELRGVNGRGLDVRLRTPPGSEAIEAGARERIMARLKRGNIQASLVLERVGRTSEARVDLALLGRLAEAAKAASAAHGLAPPTIDGLMAVRGVVDTVAVGESEEARAALDRAVLATLDEAIADFLATREREGAALAAILAGHLDRIAGLVADIAALPQRKPEAIRARLAEQVAALIEASNATLDRDRLHQEAALLATKGDVAEELDRLEAHVAHARALLAEGGAIGRKLDFLAQEFNREANTTCSKSGDRATTALGLDLKATIEQMREQIQNLE